MDNNQFTTNLLAWYHTDGRKDLPWQVDKTPYRVWIAEIMLQQTQVATVIPYYQRFMQHFPSIESLASASLDEVLHLWTGLGYYARARNLHKTAIILAQQSAESQKPADFPATIEEIIALPGIGRSTAGAILSFSRNEFHPILDGNVKRVLTRYLAIDGWPGKKQIEQQLWQLATKFTATNCPAQYNQAIMDLGASLCSRSNPNCAACPVNTHCQANQLGTQKLYPTKKQKKQLPIKHAWLLVTQKEQQVLLIKRPPTGLWGGLWCFPQFDSLTELQQAIAQPEQTTPLTAFRHTFSHYHLEIQPYLYKGANNPTNRVMEASPTLWYNLTDPAKVGLAAATNKILQQLIKG